MNLSHCDKEQAILEAARSDQWNNDLRSHAARCPVCSDIALVAHFMQLEANAARTEASSLDPGYIWWKAQLQERKETAENAVRPIAVAERIAFACGALIAVIAMVWEWPQIPSWLDRLKLIWAQNSFAGSQTNLFTVLGGGLFLLLLLPLIAIYSSWVED